MKKVLISMFVVLLLAGAVFAVDKPIQRVTSSATAGSIGPDHPLYFLDVMFDEMGVSGTADEQAIKRL